jgi:hypothetical protein
VFTAMHSEGKPATGPMSIEKTMSVYDEKKVTEKYTFYKGWLQIYVLSDNLEDFIIWHLSSTVGAELKELYSTLNLSHMFRYDEHIVTNFLLLFCHQKHSVNNAQNCMQ